MKKLFLIAFALLSFNLEAQSNEMIDKVLETEFANFATATLLILQSAEKMSAEKTPSDALLFLEESAWIKKLKTADEPITLGETCFLLMKAFDFKGGMAWSIHPTPRYATREFQFLNAIYPADKSPYRKVSGEEVLNMISWTLDYIALEGVSNEANK